MEDQAWVRISCSRPKSCTSRCWLLHLLAQRIAQADDEAAATALDRCATAHGALTVIEAQLAAHLAETRPVRDRYRVESGLFPLPGRHRR